jgi:hypothetical protein
MKCETPLRIPGKYDYWYGKGMKCETPLRISMITGMGKV